MDHADPAGQPRRARRGPGRPGGRPSAGRVRVAVDGADASQPGDLADALVEPLRLLGREVVRVRAEDQLRPASLRFERGRTDPDSFYDDWLDADGLVREVLEPLGPGGNGADPAGALGRGADRASRPGSAGAGRRRRDRQRAAAARPRVCRSS